MKNIITILLILILPVCAYLIMSKNSSDVVANAKEKNIPVMMTFTSTMCMDCKKMKEVIHEVEGNYSGRMNFVIINATGNDKKVKEYIKKYNIVLVPTMIFIDEDGNQVNKIEGAISKERLIDEIEETING